MLEQLSYGQVNPQNFMAQLGSPQLAAIGPYGINPQLSGSMGSWGSGINPNIAGIDPVTAAYLQQQLVSQALLGGGTPWSQVSPYGVASAFGQPQISPYTQLSPYAQLFGQVSPYTQIPGQITPFGQTAPFGQTSPFGQVSPYGQSPYTQMLGQGLPWVGQQTSPFSHVSPHMQLSPFSHLPSPFGHLQAQHPALTYLQAALASQYANLLASVAQQQFGRLPFGISPFGQQLNPLQQIAGFGQQLNPLQQIAPMSRGVPPFGQVAGFGTSPFQGIGTGYGAIQ